MHTQRIIQSLILAYFLLTAVESCLLISQSNPSKLWASQLSKPHPCFHCIHPRMTGLLFFFRFRLFYQGTETFFKNILAFDFMCFSTGERTQEKHTFSAECWKSTTIRRHEHDIPLLPRISPKY